jgi:EmrB/QacA subfamily drug resistance transporter
VRRHTAILVVLFGGVLMGALDIAIVGPALPAIGQTFGADGRALAWVFNSYVLCYLIGAPLIAKLSDRHGRRRIYVMSLLVFAAGSLMIAAAPSFGVLLAGRAIQAFGAGGLFPVASAVIGDSFPRERRGRALGLMGAVFGVAFLLGPLLGGVLLRWGWQWLFLINLPIAAALVLLSLRVLPQGERRSGAPFDAAGALSLSVALGGIAWGVSRLDTERLLESLSSWEVLPFLVLGAAALPLFWRAEHRAADPVLPPALFRAPQLKRVGAIAAATGLTEAAMVFLPAMAVAALDVTVSAASFMMLPLVLTLIVGAPCAGQLLDRIGAKRVIQMGLALTCLGLAILALSPLTTGTFYAGGVAVGLGLSGLLGAPLRYVTLQEAGEHRRGAGQGLLTLWLSAGRLIGAAIIGGMVASGAGQLGAYQSAMLVVAVVMLVALAVSTGLKGAAARETAVRAQ